MRKVVIALMGMVALLTMSAYAYLDWFERLDFRESDDPPAILQDPPPELGAAISKPSEFRVEMSVSAIPLAVRQGLSEGSGREFEMAEPGGRWEKTDAGIAFWSLPHQRLFSIASSKEFCIVFYEFGGFGSRYSIEAFRLGKNAATLVWRPEPWGRVTDLQGLRNAIAIREKSRPVAPPILGRR